MPTVSASARSLSPPGHPNPGRRIDARLLTFRARAADQAHATSTPGTTWPGTRAPARLIPKDTPEPPVSMPSERVSTPQQRTPTRRSSLAERFLERLPGPYLTRSLPRLFPGRSPRQSSANAAPGQFDARPRRADAGGPTILHLSHSSAYIRGLLHDPSFSVRDTRCGSLSSWRSIPAGRRGPARHLCRRDLRRSSRRCRRAWRASVASS